MANAGRFLRLKANIEKELNELAKLKDEKDSLDLESAHARTLASVLHDFYTGMERIFSRIAKELEGGMPKGEDWHKELLDDMALELEDVRPAVISEELRENLEEYLRFRHLFRSVYGFVIRGERLKPLLDNFDTILLQFKDSVARFNLFLDNLSEKLEGG